MNKGLAASRIGVAGAIMIEWIYALSGENAGPKKYIFSDVRMLT